MYIDPNSGGMLFQILAVLFGLFSASILIFSGRIRMAFAKLRRRMRNQPESEALKTISDDETPRPGV